MYKERPLGRLGRWLPKARSHEELLLVIAVLALSPSIALVSLDLRGAIQASITFGILLLFLYICSLCLPLTVVVYAVKAAFQRKRKGHQLRLLLTTYSVLTVTFAGFYYAVAYVEDYNDSVVRFYHYRSEYLVNSADPTWPVVAPQSHRAFSGMRERFWRLGELNDTIAREEREMSNLVTKDLSEVLYPSPKAKFPIFVDSFHFSALSMTLFGYGTVAPLDWKVKAVNAVQVLVGTLLVVVMFGMLFCNWGPESSAADNEPRPS